MRKRDAAFEALVRGLTRRRVSRRDALKLGGAGLGAAFLAACGVQGTDSTPTPAATGTTAAPSPSPLPPKAGELVVANWPLYIDLEDGQSETLQGFREATGIDITYREDINDNDEFFGTDLRQQLSANQPTGWDVIVLTDWMIAKLVRLGWLMPLDHDRLPNVTENLDEKFRDPDFDPGNAHSFPWAAGITGIGYDIELTGRDITSINDLFSEEFRGKVGMFSEMRDTINFGLYLDGVVPAEATMADVQRAVDRLREQRDAGIVRGYFGNDYTDQLAGGNLAVTMAWSGDVFALRQDNPNLRFVIPEEGGNRWSDNMAIPILAEHPTDAHEWMNYVYQPEVAAAITEWVWYESPVQDTVVRELIAADAKEFDDPSLAELAQDENVWPSEDVLARTHGYKSLDPEEEQAWHDLFDPVIQG